LTYWVNDFNVSDSIIQWNDSYGDDYYWNWGNWGGNSHEMLYYYTWGTLDHCLINERSAQFYNWVDIHNAWGGSVSYVDCVINQDAAVEQRCIWLAGEVGPPYDPSQIWDRGAGAPGLNHNDSWHDYILDLDGDGIADGDYHLTGDSPAIDAGAGIVPATDIDGDDRTAAPDIGADEAAPSCEAVVSVPAYGYESYLGAYVVVLDGSASVGGTFAWSQVSGAVVSIDDASSAIASYNAPFGQPELTPAEATIVVELSVDAGCATAQGTTYIRLPGDAGGNDQLDLVDLILYRQGDASADFNGDGAVNADDLTIYRSAVADGRGR
jgi:hypothetical protein